MKILGPLPLAGTTGTTACHGGNDYRGPGVWQHPHETSKKRARIPPGAMKNPLDLTDILMPDNYNYNRDSIKATRRKGQRCRHSKNAGRASRLESLRLLRAPSHGVGSPGECTSTLKLDDNLGCLQRSQGEKPPRTAQQYLGPVPSNIVRGAPERASESTLSCRQKVVSEEATRRPAPECANSVAVIQRCEWTLKKDTAINGPTLQDFSNTTSELRVPNALVKMAVDDKCNAQALDARSKLRVLLEQQDNLGKIMKQHHIETCLGTTRGGRNKDFGAREHQYPSGKHSIRRGRLTGQCKGHRLNDVKSQEPRRRAHFHPLLLMSERDLQQVELQYMRLEDAEAVYISKFEEAKRRKQDYSTYYSLAQQYGPLLDTDFAMAVYPGKVYAGKVSDAARWVHNWWWSAWPPVLRQRKAAALTIQSVFRGFVQRKKWHGIIRLRTLWGNTRITAHVFVSWRDHVAKLRRVAAFTCCFQKRCAGRCLAAWRGFVDAQRRQRENVVFRRLKQVKDGIRARVFEGWVGYTETSLAVERMRRRVCTRFVLKAWEKYTRANRAYTHLCWACATLAGRALRWRARTRFIIYRRACCKIQRFSRGRMAVLEVQRRAAEASTRQAEEIAQAVEDERLGLLVEAEQARRDRLQAKLDEHILHMQDKATAFLRTPAGEAAVSDLVRVMELRKETQKAHDGSKINFKIFGPQNTTKTEARQEVIRRFISHEKASLRHDFNAEWPPAFRCPHAACNATFVDPGHCARHAADAHAKDTPGIWELGLCLSESASLAIFESYLSKLGETIIHSEGQRIGASSLRNKDPSSVHRRLDLWKATVRWRAVPSCSPHYSGLTAAVCELLPVTSNKTTKESTIDEGGQSHHPRELSNTMHKGRAEVDSGRWGMGMSMAEVGKTNSDRNNMFEYAVDPLILEQASWQALVDLHEVVGKGFLRSTPYLQYLDSSGKPVREAIAMTAADIASRKRAEWLKEARTLQAAAFHRNKEMDIDRMAEEALALALEGQGDTGIFESLVDDQVVLLAVVILAERGAFAKVISAVWKEAVDEAARQHSREERRITPEVAEALSKAGYSIARSIVMDKLIDECVTDLTKPGGEMWPDKRATTAVADGIVYRVRDAIMTETIDTLLAELLASGDAASLMSAAALQRRERDSRQGRQTSIVAVDNRILPVEANFSGEGLYGEAKSRWEVGQSEEDWGNPSNRRVAIESDVDTGSWTTEPLAECHDDDGSSNTNDFQQTAPETIDRVRSKARKTITISASEEQAAVMLQSAFRRKAVYRRTKALIATNFVKLFDPMSGSLYWYNQKTGESSWDKPPIIDLFFCKKH